MLLLVLWGAAAVVGGVSGSMGGEGLSRSREQIRFFFCLNQKPGNAYPGFRV